MTDSPISVATAFVRAVNRQNVDALVELMAPDHRFVDSLGTAHQGREMMRKCWAAYFQMVPDYSLAIEETYADGPVVLMLGIAQGTYEGSQTSEAPNRWHTPIAIRALVDDGHMLEWRVYADNEPMRRRIAGS